MKLWNLMLTKIKQKALRNALRLIQISLVIATTLLPFGLTKVCLLALRIIVTVLLWIADEKSTIADDAMEECEPP